MIRLILISAAVVTLSACGVGTMPSRTMTSTQALAGTAEWLEFESPQMRHELFRDVARNSAQQQGQTGPVLFPVMQNGELIGGQALDLRGDLLQAPDAGVLQLTFDTRGDRFTEDRRDAFQGLSEREATELVARSLLHRWGIKSTGPVLVIRAPGAPYAAAWIDGVLRINPAFVYMAAAPVVTASN
ncbi:MAG: hypothetical protein SFW67_16755 [Myxococcaceae bacterium]|nr:hypothetical protein [Myxococcaceae bacterium]